MGLKLTFLANFNQFHEKIGNWNGVPTSCKEKPYFLFLSSISRKNDRVDSGVESGVSRVDFI